MSGDDIKKRVSAAISQIPSYLQDLLISIHGLNGKEPKSFDELASEAGIEAEEIEELDAEAIRALMYGHNKSIH